MVTGSRAGMLRSPSASSAWGWHSGLLRSVAGVPFPRVVLALRHGMVEGRWKSVSRGVGITNSVLGSIPVMLRLRLESAIHPTMRQLNVIASSEWSGVVRIADRVTEWVVSDNIVDNTLRDPFVSEKGQKEWGRRGRKDSGGRIAIVIPSRYC